MKKQDKLCKEIFSQLQDLYFAEIVDWSEWGSATRSSDYRWSKMDFTPTKTVKKYIDGYATFSKKLMSKLPFLQNTLPRILLRDFYKK